MATINLGAIKFNWKGAYAGGTAYAVDDVVSSGGSSYVCILASTGNATSNGTYWEQMSSAGTNGTDGTDLSTTLTTQGDILYRDGSGLQRLPKGTAGQVLQMNSGATAPEYGTVSSDWVKISSDTLSGSVSSFSTDAFSSSYNTYKVFMNNMSANSSSSGALNFRARNSSGDITGTDYYAAGRYQEMASGGTSAGNQGQWNVNQLNMSGWYMPDTTTQSGYASYNYEWTFYNMNSTDYNQIACRYGGWERTGARVFDIHLNISVTTTSVLTGFTINHAAGANFANDGKILIYGLKE